MREENESYLEGLGGELNVTDEEERMYVRDYGYGDETKKMGEEGLKGGVDGRKESLAVVFCGNEGGMIGFGEEDGGEEVEREERV